LVSFSTIIRKLMEGEYSTSTGHPFAEEEFEEFVKEVKEKVEELRGLEDEEVEDKVLTAIGWAEDSICRTIYKWRFIPEHGEYYLSISLMSCNHPETGKFYLVKREEANAMTGAWFYDFLLTRNYREALKSYSEKKRAEEEKF